MTEFIKLPDKAKAFSVIADKITEDAQDKFDLILKPSEFAFGNELKDLIMYSPLTGGTCVVQPWALSQICQKIGVPVSYINKCVSSNEMKLAVQNLNRWWSIYSASSDKMQNLYRLRRAKPNILRAFLSSRYSVFNDVDIINFLNSSSLIKDRFFYDTFFMTDGRLAIRLVDKNTKVVDDVFVGLEIFNSEVGMSRLEIRLYLYRVACTNGMLVPIEGSKFVHIHYGIEQEDFVSGFNFVVSKIPAYVQVVTQIIEATKNATIFMQTYSEYVDNLNEFLRDTELVGEIVNTYVDKYDKTHWGFVNAITEVAQSRPAGQRLFLEEYAGRILLAGTVPKEV